MADEKKDEKKKEEKQKPASKKGFVILTAPEGASSCSVDGVEYDVEEGLVEVSEKHAPALEAHGFKK